MSQAVEAHPATPVGEVAAGLLRSHPLAARALPPADVEWANSVHVCEVYGVEPAPEAVVPVIDRFVANDIVAVERKLRPTERKISTLTNTYRTSTGVVGWVREHIDAPRTFECGHPGLRNLGDGRYTCQHDECNAVYDRETAAAVFGGGEP